MSQSPAGTALPLIPRGHELESELGRGSVGVVLRALDRGLARRVAMKRLDPARANAREAERFVAEARLTGGLEHPNILPVHEVANDEAGRPYFTMRLVRGRTLADLLAHAFDPADPAQLFRVLQIFLKVCDAVRYAHSCGVVHCDLKPQNVMVGEHGEVYLMDWGIARSVRGADLNGVARFATAPGAKAGIEGTPGYLAPEQAEGRSDEIDERTDVFGLGAILYRIACGRVPFEAPDIATQLALTTLGQVEPPPPSVPTRLANIVLKAIAHERTQRYASVEQLQAALEAHLHGGSTPPATHFPAGTVLVREGDPGDSAYLLELGHCMVYRMIDGERRVLGQLQAGDTFGETSLFASAPRMATIEAVTPIKVVRITREEFDEELSRSHWVARCASALARRFTEQQDRLARAEDERDLAVAEVEILRFLQARATDGVKPRRVPWRPLRFQLSRRFGRMPQEIETMLAKLPAFRLDPATDELVEVG